MNYWAEKYRPKTISDLVGHGSTLEKLKEAVQKKQPVLIHGPVGVGKTSSVYAIAGDLDYETIEVNASDLRNADSMNTVVGESLQQQSLFQKKKLVIVDEVDGIAGREDRGGLQALQKLLELRSHAVVMLANDIWHSKFSTLRKKCLILEYRRPNYLSIAKLLRNICDKEGITYDEECVKTLARRASGDIRSAITDLQSYSSGSKLLNNETLTESNEREYEGSILDALRVVLKSRKLENTKGAFDRVNGDLNEAALWIEENIFREYKKPEDIAGAYDALSKADVFRGRIRRWQHWRFLVYINALLTVGVSLAKKEKYPGFTMYQRNKRILKMWMNNQKNGKRKDIAGKLAPKVHCSQKRFIKEYIPHLKIMAKQKKLPELKLTEDELIWLAQ